MNVEEIRTSEATDKGTLYLQYAHSLATKASEIADSDIFFQKKMKEEVINSWRKCESADCEYTAYVNANACEIWLAKLEGFISGKLTMKDLI